MHKPGSHADRVHSRLGVEPTCDCSCRLMSTKDWLVVSSLRAIAGDTASFSLQGLPHDPHERKHLAHLWLLLAAMRGFDVYECEHLAKRKLAASQLQKKITCCCLLIWGGQ